jgi:hypothetical protein
VCRQGLSPAEQQTSAQSLMMAARRGAALTAIAAASESTQVKERFGLPQRNQFAGSDGAFPARQRLFKPAARD